MNTDDYVLSKKVTLEELEKYFKPIGKKENSSTDSCSYCGDSINIRILPSEAWTEVLYCHKCSSISVMFPQDLMSGCKDTKPCVIYQ